MFGLTSRLGGALGASLQQSKRSIWIYTGHMRNENRAFRTLNTCMEDHFKALKHKRYFEKGYERRKRKKGESAIRLQNRKVGSMLNFIIEKKKAGY